MVYMVKSFPTLYQSCVMFSVSVLPWRCLRHFSIGFSANEKKYKTLSKNMTKRFFIIISPLQIYTFIMITQKMCCYCANSYFCRAGRIRTCDFTSKGWRVAPTPRRIGFICPGSPRRSCHRSFGACAGHRARNFDRFVILFHVIRCFPFSWDSLYISFCRWSQMIVSFV